MRKLLLACHHQRPTNEMRKHHSPTHRRSARCESISRHLEDIGLHLAQRYGGQSVPTITRGTNPANNYRCAGKGKDHARRANGNHDSIACAFAAASAVAGQCDFVLWKQHGVVRRWWRGRGCGCPSAAERYTDVGRVSNARSPARSDTANGVRRLVAFTAARWCPHNVVAGLRFPRGARRDGELSDLPCCAQTPASTKRLRAVISSGPVVEAAISAECCGRIENTPRG
jgi:hypothetical protein